MTEYLIRRLVFTVITVLIVSGLVFTILQIPPGDAVDRIVSQRVSMGDIVTEEEEEQLRQIYGLNRPMIVQYWDWFGGLLTGDMGRSTTGAQVSQLVGERLGNTIFLSLLSLVVTYAIAFPIGVYSATHQYGVGDYLATFFGFLGLATPNFLLALVMVYLAFRWFGLSIGGFLSPEFAGAPFSLAKLADIAAHMVIPVLVIATSATAGTIRTLRATLLDELGKQYAVTAKAKGVPFRKLLYKYPVRLAIIPIVSGIGYIFPFLLAGQTIVAIVLNLQTLGPLMFNALLGQDLELAASVLMIQSLLGIFGVVVADILLTVVDPRIRFDRGMQ